MRVTGVAGLAILLGLLLQSDEGTVPESGWTGLEGTTALAAAPCPALSALEPSGRRKWWSEEVSARELALARSGRFRVFGRPRARLVVPVDWHQDPLAARVYRNRLHKLRFLAPLLRTYADAGDVRALEQAQDLALDWVEQNDSGDPATPPDVWRDKNVGDRVPFLAYTVRAAACEGMLDRRDARRFLASVREHGRFLSDPANYVPTNHGLFVDLGLIRLTRFFPFLDESPRWAERARDRFLRTLRGRQANGVWLEHSSSYQLLVIKSVEDLLRLVGTDATLERILDRMREAAAWFVRPDGVIAQFGDSSQGPAPEWALVATASQKGARAFFGGGFYFVRTTGRAGENAYLAVSNGFHNATHKHADELSFELHDRGRPIVTDTGMHSKDPGPERDLTLSAAAHNTLTVNGAGFALSERDSYGSGLVASGMGSGWYAVEGRNPLVRSHGVEHRRLFLYRPGEALIVVDGVRSSQLHEYARHLHLAPEIEITASGPDFLSVSAGGFEAWVTDGPIGSTSERAIVRDQNEPPGGVTFPRFRERVPRNSITFRSTGSTEVMALGIALGSGPLHVTAADRAAGGWRVTMRPSGGRETTLNIVREGRVLAVSE